VAVGCESELLKRALSRFRALAHTSEAIVVVIAIVCHDGEVGVGIDGRHRFQLLRLVLHIILHDAETVNPKVPLTQQPGKHHAVSDGFGEPLPVAREAEGIVEAKAAEVSQRGIQGVHALAPDVAES